MENEDGVPSDAESRASLHDMILEMKNWGLYQALLAEAPPTESEADAARKSRGMCRR